MNTIIDDLFKEFMSQAHQILDDDETSLYVAERTLMDLSKEFEKRLHEAIMRSKRQRISSYLQEITIDMDHRSLLSVNHNDPIFYEISKNHYQVSYQSQISANCKDLNILSRDFPKIDRFWIT